MVCQLSLTTLSARPIFKIVDNKNPIKFVNAGMMAELLSVKTRQIRRWAREGKIPKLTLPGGRFVFDPKAVIEEMRLAEKQQGGS